MIYVHQLFFDYMCSIMGISKSISKPSFQSHLCHVPKYIAT